MTGVYTIDDSCQLFGKSRNGIESMIKNGLLPPILPRPPGKGCPRQWRKADVDKILNKDQTTKILSFSPQQQAELKLLMKQAIFEVFSEDTAKIK